MSKARIISVSGMIAGDLNDDNNVFREVRKTMIKNFFSKEWIEHQKLVQAYDQVQEKMKSHKKPIDFWAHIFYYKGEKKQYTP